MAIVDGRGRVLGFGAMVIVDDRGMVLGIRGHGDCRREAGVTSGQAIVSGDGWKWAVSDTAPRFHVVEASKKKRDSGTIFFIYFLFLIKFIPWRVRPFPPSLGNV